MRERLPSAINMICLFREIGGGGLVAGWAKSGILNFSKFWRNVAESISAGKVRWPDLYYAVERGVGMYLPPHSRWRRGGSKRGPISHIEVGECFCGEVRTRGRFFFWWISGNRIMESTTDWL